MKKAATEKKAVQLNRSIFNSLGCPKCRPDFKMALTDFLVSVGDHIQLLAKKMVCGVMLAYCFMGQLKHFLIKVLVIPEVFFGECFGVCQQHVGFCGTTTMQVPSFIGFDLWIGPENAIKDSIFIGSAMGNPASQDFKIAAPAPVAEPATMLLLGSGLIGLACLGRKKINNQRLTRIRPEVQPPMEGREPKKAVSYKKMTRPSISKIFNLQPFTFILLTMFTPLNFDRLAFPVCPSVPCGMFTWSNTCQMESFVNLIHRDEAYLPGTEPIRPGQLIEMIL